jgi:hypothetical protein
MPSCKTIRPLGLLAVGLLAVGCGQEKFAEVTGKATRGGKPVPNLVINFTPEKGLRSVALTDQNGAFKMVHSSGRHGVLVGPHKVWVALPLGSKEDLNQVQRLAQQRADPEITAILHKYGNAETTPLTFEITTSRVIDLALD